MGKISTQSSYRRRSPRRKSDHQPLYNTKIHPADIILRPANAAKHLLNQDQISNHATEIESDATLSTVSTSNTIPGQPPNGSSQHKISHNQQELRSRPDKANVAWDELDEVDQLVFLMHQRMLIETNELPIDWQRIKQLLFENGFLTLDDARCENVSRRIKRRHQQVWAGFMQHLASNLSFSEKHDPWADVTKMASDEDTDLDNPLPEPALDCSQEALPVTSVEHKELEKTEGSRNTASPAASPVPYKTSESPETSRRLQVYPFLAPTEHFSRPCISGQAPYCVDPQKTILQSAIKEEPEASSTSSTSSTDNVKVRGIDLAKIPRLSPHRISKAFHTRKRRKSQGSIGPGFTIYDDPPAQQFDTASGDSPSIRRLQSHDSDLPLENFSSDDESDHSVNFDANFLTQTPRRRKIKRARLGTRSGQ